MPDSIIYLTLATFVFYFIFGILFITVVALIIKRIFNINGNAALKQKEYLLLKQIAIKVGVDSDKISEIDNL
ncbi:hypothetical protein SAMN05216490_0593 [Mucilaginibacter mallensis]|uniref:Uncharacterized protein n=1 Tax=Mucilaginibacter mallensis TaxID=652787 RepID=A0A1H1PPC1_MUCMA|nr:hypothetical protein [Mucilaginibacter mallensis]SDS12945.1 hypothetical protein SAMN05216490_0593 [Mucilaginibacter mallensis]